MTNSTKHSFLMQTWHIIRSRSVKDIPGLLRMSADATLVAFSYSSGMLLRFVAAMGQQGYGPERQVEFLRQTINGLFVLVPISLVVFNGFGFYNRTRLYNLRYKCVVLVQGITTAYLFSGFVAFLAIEYVGFSRSGFLLSYSFSIFLLIASRLISTVWRKVVLDEAAGKVGAMNEPLRTQTKTQILLIGGAGYIGSALLRKLLDSGYKVRLLDVFLYGREPIQDMEKHPNLEIVVGDFRQVDKVVAAMQGVGSVIHLGGLVGDPACALDEALTIEVNLSATLMIAEVAKGAGVKRFIFASTCSVYGANDNILDEHSALNPVSLYARSKIASERVLLDVQSETFQPVILRFGTIFGLSGRTRFDLVVNLLTAKAILDGKITLYGGDQWRPFVHVDDAALAVYTVLQAPIEQVGGEIFNIGSDNMNYTLRQVGELIKAQVPTAELLDLGSNDDRRNYRVSFRKAHDLLGYVPKWQLEEGISQVVEAIRSGKVLDYTLSKYSNVKYLSGDRINTIFKSAGWERKVLDSIAPLEPVINVPSVRN